MEQVTASVVRILCFQGRAPSRLLRALSDTHRPGWPLAIEAVSLCRRFVQIWKFSPGGVYKRHLFFCSFLRTLRLLSSFTSASTVIIA